VGDEMVTASADTQRHEDDDECDPDATEQAANENTRRQDRFMTTFKHDEALTAQA